MQHWSMEQIKKLRPAGLVSSPAFSHVAIVPPGATTIYLGGQNAVDETGQLIGREDAAVQAAKALGNAKLALAAAGAGFEDVLQWNVLLVDGTDINSVYGVIGPQLASDSSPLVTAAFITQLGVPGALIEISAVVQGWQISRCPCGKRWGSTRELFGSRRQDGLDPYSPVSPRCQR